MRQPASICVSILAVCLATSALAATDAAVAPSLSFYSSSNNYWCDDAKQLQARGVAFVPRGGGVGRRLGRRKKRGDADADADAAAPEMEGGEGDDAVAAAGDANGDDVTSSGEVAAGGDDGSSESFDLEEVNKKLVREEVNEIRKSQELIQKQRHRRELDKTWLDRGITGFIEFFENLFSWKVIDV